MTSNGKFQPLTPIEAGERYSTLDLLRGLALFGVLLVNLLYFFRLSLFDRFLRFHSHAGWWNHAVDLFVAELIEFKAINLFSLTFGVGVAIQAERATSRGAEAFLIRRFLTLLAFGMAHMVLISNVDILMLYAICGLLMIPLLRLPIPALGIIGVAAIYLPPVLSRLSTFPSEPILRAHAAEATRIYGHANFGTILEFRWLETQTFIAPLLLMTAQRTFGLMLVGVALWRAGVVQNPHRYRRWLWAACLVGGVIGLFATTAEVWSQSTGTPVAPALVMFGSHVPLAFAYAAALLIWSPSRGFWTPVAAMGRIALTNYLAQSILFALLFYGYAFGLFGRLSPSSAAIIGVAVYAGQLWFSVWWLNRYRFGPFEWLWRSASYRRLQPMRLASPPRT